MHNLSAIREAVNNLRAARARDQETGAGLVARAAARLTALARQFAVPETTIHRAALLGGIVQLETDPAALHQMIARARETAQ